LLSEHQEFRSDLLLDDGWNIGYPSLTMDAGYAKARMYSFSYQYALPDNVISQVDAKVYGNAVTHFMDDTRRPSVPMHMDMPGWSSTYGAYIHTVLVPGGDHLTTLRAEMYRTAARAEMTMYPVTGAPMFMLTLPDAERWTTALFVKEDWNISDGYVLSLNTRLEQVTSNVLSEFGRQQLSVFGYNTEHADRRPVLSGSMTITKNVGEDDDASITIGYAERVPTLNEAYGFYLYNRFDGYDYIGDLALRNERSLQAEATIRHQTEFLQISTTGFVNRINGYIDGAVDAPLSAMTIGAHGVKRFHNLPYAVMSGVEASLLIHPHEQLDVITTAKYLRGIDNTNEPLPLIPPLKLLSSVRYRVKTLTVQAEAEYASSQQKVRASVGESITPSYLLAHLRMSYAAPFQEIQCAIHGGIENLFDAQYRDHLDWGNIPRPGRNVYISVTFSR
jgi:iron complex outermembrane receptor protein